MNQWQDAVHRVGEDKNFERAAQGQPTLSPVYAAAGHEVRPWLTQAGKDGMQSFIASLNEGAEFELAYQKDRQAHR